MRTGLISTPQFAQTSYYKGVFYLTNPQDNSKSLEEVHKATKVADLDTGKLGYKYTKKDARVIKSDSAKCMACHGDMLERDANNKPVNYIHDKMLQASMLTFNCTDCHKDVDIRPRSPGRVTTRVDRTSCPVCHDPSNETRTAAESEGETWAAAGAPSMPRVMTLHGPNEADGKKWISEHPRVAMSIGISQCRKCHVKDSELDFCRDCHLRGGFRPESHQVVYETNVNKIFPESKKDQAVAASWKGYHFVVVREALEKLGTKVDSPRNLPMDKIEKLPCGACHILEDWCTKCHIKHNPDWLNPNDGHPAVIDENGANYCFRCHDSRGSKCESCHDYVGQLR